MGKVYLNKRVRFQCQSGNMVWFSPQNSNMKIKINGMEALTNDCKLGIVGGVRPGQCNLLHDPSTGGPMPCSSAMISGAWNNESRLKMGGKEALTSCCSISCPLGGCIKPFKPTIVCLNVNDNAKVQGVNIPLAYTDSNNTNVNHSKFYNNQNVGDKESDFTKTYNYNTVNSDENVECNEEPMINQDYSVCDYKNCKKAKDCKYLQTAYILKETNESKNAAELKINMGKDTFDLYAGECANIATSLYENNMFSIAHHHIIPVNQCFKIYPEIVKLANFYNYNINKAENGICLPTMNLGYDKQPFEQRKNISFAAMKMLGKQWHKGGHKYSCNISADLDSILPRPFYHYKSAIEEKLLIPFCIKLTDECKCRSENYDQQAKEFETAMDHICNKVANYLMRFKDNSRKSYPYYISKFAFYYAFEDELNEYENKLFGKDG